MTKKEQEYLLKIIEDESDNLIIMKGYDEYTFKAFERIRAYVKKVSKKG